MEAWCSISTPNPQEFKHINTKVAQDSVGKIVAYGALILAHVTQKSCLQRKLYPPAPPGKPSSRSPLNSTKTVREVLLYFAEKRFH